MTKEQTQPKKSKRRRITVASLAFCASFIVGCLYAMIAAGEEVERYDMHTEHKTPRAEYVSYQMSQAIPIAILFGVVGLGVTLFCFWDRSTDNLYAIKADDQDRS